MRAPCRDEAAGWARRNCAAPPRVRHHALGVHARGAHAAEPGARLELAGWSANAEREALCPTRCAGWSRAPPHALKNGGGASG
eukprot:7181537-Prymnesium_polylepis.1